MYLVIEISASGQSIADLNARCQHPTNPDAAIAACRDFLNGILGGGFPSTVQVTTRSTSASISTGGSGSQQETYSKA